MQDHTSVPNQVTQTLTRRLLLVAPLALPMLVTARRARAQNVTWLQYPGSAQDIGTGGGKVCVIGRNRSGDGYGIFRWNGRATGNVWDPFPGGGVNVAVDGSGNPWVTTASNSIYRWNGSAWDRLPGAARDIAAGGGKIFVVGNVPVPGGFSIHRWNGSGWDRLPGGAVRIAADDTGAPWLVNDQGKVYLWAGSRFEQVPGDARDIGAGGGEVYAIGTNAVLGGYGIYRWAGVGARPWQNIPGGAVRVAADGQGKPWVVNDGGNIYRG